MKSKEFITEEKWGVFRKGGSIGDKKSDKPLHTFDTKEEAKAKAASMRKTLSVGERKHYGMGYSFKKINEDSWGVFQAGKALGGGPSKMDLALYTFDTKDEAADKAESLSKKGKSYSFRQINESTETPYDHLIGKYTHIMKGGVRYPGRIDKIIKTDSGYMALATYNNEPGSMFRKHVDNIE